MKRKMWVSSPLMYFAVFVMLLMTIASYGENTMVFIVELSVTLLFALSIIFLKVQFLFHTKSVLKNAKQILLAENEQALSEFTMPMVVTGLDGDIVWKNTTFMNIFEPKNDPVGNSILEYIYPRTLRQVLNQHATSIQYKNKQLTVYSVKTENSCIFYFIDDTYYKEIHKEYSDKKTVVAMISFDNRDELIRGAGGGEESRISAEVETILNDWAKEMNGFIRKLSGGRYLMLSDEQHLNQAKNKRFTVLDKVREIKGKDDLSATISVGIGRDASSPLESELWARQALEMALGRGGDQIAMVGKGEKYEFYGGLSKGVEKRDKVRTRVIAETLKDHIKRADKVFIMGHRNSDLDSMGSAIGMWSVITKSLKKHAFIVVNQNQSLALPLVKSMTDRYPEKRIFISPNDSQQEITGKTLIIVVDTHADNFVEVPDLLKMSNAIVVIDHHRMMVNYIRNPLIFYHEPYASSASEMVAELIQYIDSSSLGNVEAQALLSGIMLDTKNFVLKTGVRTFEASAYLRRMGADTVAVKRYFSNSIATYKEKSNLVANAQIYKECAISFIEDMNGNTRVAAAQAADELLSIEGVKASFVLFGQDKDVNISARSLGDLNVQLIMEEFHGGGHLTMAGAFVKGKAMQDVKKDLVEVLNKKLQNK